MLGEIVVKSSGFQGKVNFREYFKKYSGEMQGFRIVSPQFHFIPSESKKVKRENEVKLYGNLLVA